MQLTNFFPRFFAGKSYFEDFPAFLCLLDSLSPNGSQLLFHTVI